MFEEYDGDLQQNEGSTKRRFKRGKPTSQTRTRLHDNDTLFKRGNEDEQPQADSATQQAIVHGCAHRSVGWVRYRIAPVSATSTSGFGGHRVSWPEAHFDGG
jgi:hypothetical protein